MSMTIVVTRNVSGRFRGFLASVMCEIAPGVYTAPRMNAGIRERVWSVLEGWWALGADAMIVMTWPESKLSGGQEVRVLGGPPDYELNQSAKPSRRELIRYDDVYLVRTELTGAERVKLGIPDPEVPF